MSNKLDKYFWEKFEKEGIVIEIDRMTNKLYYEALMELYNEATKDMGDDPTDDIELAFDTIVKLIDEADKTRRKAERQYKIDSKLIGLYETKILKLEQMLEQFKINAKQLHLYHIALCDLEQANDMDEVKRILERTLT